MAPLTTYLCERNALLREGLKSFLTGTGYKVTAEFGCISDIMGEPCTDVPKLIISGICRSGESVPPAQYYKEMREHVMEAKLRFPQARIVILIPREEVNDIPDDLLWIADSCILRDTSHDAFINYLNLAMMGEKALPAPMVSMLANGKAANGRSNGSGNGATRDSCQLSDRERDIIQCLIRGDSNKQIAQHLQIAEATVKVHLKTILRKLGAHNRTQVALWAVNHGFHSTAANSMFELQRMIG